MVELSDQEGGSAMVLKAAFVLLAIWLLGVIGLYNIGTLVHVPLLIGLLLLLIGGLKARDAAGRTDRQDTKLTDPLPKKRPL